MVPLQGWIKIILGLVIAAQPSQLLRRRQLIIETDWAGRLSAYRI